MRKQSTSTIVLVLLALSLLAWSDAAAFGGNTQPGQRTVQSPNGTPVRTYLNINNISTVYTAFGIADIDIQEANSGLVYPKGSRKTAMFESGFLWGGIVNGQVRVGGSAYRTGLQTGKILPNGTAESPDLPKNRIYRVRPDWRTGSLASEVADEGVAESQIRSQYEKDWNEWPATDGAPYADVDSNGSYDPNVDIPGFPGADQTIWYVANDLNSGLTTNLYGANPLGLELQVTVWAYAQQGALGNMFFKRFLLINKGSNRIDSMYVSQWADPDLGNATDDYAGCDTALSLGYCYNATASDATYDPLPPPAAGFDFFQGPAVPSPEDTAIFLGKLVPGRKNLPMTAFYYFARGDPSVTDPTQGSYEGTQQFYNFFRGRIGRTGAPFTDPNTNEATPFALAGDPQTRTGWVDGQILPAGDRRIGMASGPFTMAVGDTQEIVVAEIVAGAQEGVDRLSAIGLLKFYDQQAQLAYNNFFQLPTPPAAPKVTAVPLNRRVVLQWGSDTTAYRSTEASSQRGFVFEGYNVYQLPSPSATLDQARRVATYDIPNGIGKIIDVNFDPAKGTVLPTVAQFGNDVGVERTIVIANDDLAGGGPLVNGKRYYFAVTAYSYNPDPEAVPNNLESPPQVITVVPQSNNPGERYGAGAFDTLSDVRHRVNVAGASLSEGQVFPIVIDPSKLTGHTYVVSFDSAMIQLPDTVVPRLVWTLTDSTTGRVLVKNDTNQTGNADYVIVDGMQVKVTGPLSLGMRDWDIPSGARRWTWAGADGFGLEGFEHAMGNAEEHWFSGSSIPAAQLHNVIIKFTDMDSTNGNILNPSDTLASYAYRYLRGATAAPAKPEFAPFIKNPVAGYAFQDYQISMPFAAYDAETGQRLAVGHLENNVALGRVDGKYFPPTNIDTVGGDNVAGSGPREWFFIFGTPYTGATIDSALAKDILNTTLPIAWVGTPNRRNGAGFYRGDEFLILANHPNSKADVFSFTAPAPTMSAQQAKEDINQINVFPNPYYGVNTQEINKYQRFITFNHLPARATVRIFNLAGVLVRTIQKSDANSQFLRWDLSNEAGLPAASGLYIAHIEMGDLGTKIVKFAIIQERQILDRF